jgi:hypothetical protein
VLTLLELSPPADDKTIARLCEALDPADVIDGLAIKIAETQELMARLHLRLAHGQTCECGELAIRDGENCCRCGRLFGDEITQAANGSAR